MWKFRQISVRYKSPLPEFLEQDETTISESTYTCTNDAICEHPSIHCNTMLIMKRSTLWRNFWSRMKWPFRKAHTHVQMMPSVNILLYTAIRCLAWKVLCVLQISNSLSFWGCWGPKSKILDSKNPFLWGSSIHPLKNYSCKPWRAQASIFCLQTFCLHHCFWNLINWSKFCQHGNMHGPDGLEMYACCPLLSNQFN